VARGWLYASIAVGLCIGIVFAAFPALDLQVADWFFDHDAAKFPLATAGWSNLVRRIANWIPWLLMLPAVGALLLKLVFPSSPMRVQP
jgi:lipid A 4'-phosphatase